MKSTTSDPAPVATGGVPTGYRLGARWTAGRECHPGGDTTVWCDEPHVVAADYVRRDSNGNISAGACAAHAVEMGALVPADTGGAAQAAAIKAAVNKECSHVRQWPSFEVHNGMAEVRVSDALPCADPKCHATVQGVHMVTLQRIGFYPLRIPTKDEANVVRELVWDRVATYDGWRWSLR